MPSIRARLTMLFFRVQKNFLLRRGDNTRLMRRVTEFAGSRIRMPRNIRMERSSAGGVTAARLTNTHVSANRQRILVYLHGGGYVVGSPMTHRAFAARLGQRAGAGEIWMPDYRLAPEHPFPAAVDDVVNFWNALVKKHPKHEFILAGESAGGGLCVSLCVTLRESQQPLPTRMYLLSPWLDLSLKSRTHTSQGQRDPFLNRALLEKHFARFYAGDTPREHPLLSPLFADLHELPPTLVHVGSREVLLDDSRQFTEKARKQNVDVTLEIHTGLWHAWPVFQTAPECIATIRHAGEWLAKANRK
ncbi:MAG: alpha/beta hydrolase [Pseudomonadota bacterium]